MVGFAFERFKQPHVFFLLRATIPQLTSLGPHPTSDETKLDNRNERDWKQFSKSQHSCTEGHRLVMV